MKLIFLGTGTSQGIPVIGCECAVCSSSDVRDTRLRSSVMFIDQDFHLLIDMGPDLRQQMLNNNLNNIDAICITHEHNDHVSGLDEIRPINFKWNKSIPIYTLSRVIDELKRRFHYAFEDTYTARPRLSAHVVQPGQSLSLGPFDIEIISVNHGNLDILGFIVNNIAYLTDVKTLDQTAMQRIARCHTVIISALHKKKHLSHQSLNEALELVDQLPADRFYITHIAHQMGFHERESTLLPRQVYFAHDGLVVNDF